MNNINLANNKPYLVAVNKLQGSSKNDKPATVYINPNNIAYVRPSSKKERLNESYELKGNTDLNETNITLSNGANIYVKGNTNEVIEALGKMSDVEARILDIEV